MSHRQVPNDKNQLQIIGGACWGITIARGYHIGGQLGKKYPVDERILIFNFVLQTFDLPS